MRTDKDALLSLAKSVVATIVAYFVLVFIIDRVNEYLTGERMFDFNALTLTLLSPEVLLAVLVATVALCIFMLKSLSE